MTRARLSVRACVFDAYGTLFDFASATASCRDVLGDQVPALTALWRDKQLQYTWLRSLQGQHAGFWQVTGEALDFALETLGIDDPALRDRLMGLYLHLAAFPEVAETLTELKRLGFATGILSNGEPAMIESLVRGNGLEQLIDARLSVEQASVFKTHPRIYQLALDHFGLPAEQIAFVSSNGWDAYAASAFGMKVVWCNRYGQRGERLPGAPDFEITSLVGLPELLTLG